jgi:glycogen operon protein
MELGHRQGGNNNPYCQDNELTWIDWQKADSNLTSFAAHVLHLRSTLGCFADHWYQPAKGDTSAQLEWRQPDGRAMAVMDWQDEHQRGLLCRIDRTSPADTPLVLLFNPHDQALRFALPKGQWRILLDSAQPNGRPQPAEGQGFDALVCLPPSTLMLLQDTKE